VSKDYFNSEQKQDESLQIDVYTHDDSFSIQNVTEYDFGADDKMFRVHTQHRIWFFPYNSIDHIEYIYVDRLHKDRKLKENRKKAKWEDEFDIESVYNCFCSNCKRANMWKSPFCPNCGAEMESD